VRAPIRIVLDPLDTAWDAIFVTLEIYNSIVALVSATFMPSRDSTVIVTPAGIRLRRKQRRVRLAFVQIITDGSNDESSARRDGF
jgi:hypothetical protein